MTPEPLQSMVRWTRTISVVGPKDWVMKTRATSLAQGVHFIGVQKDGYVPRVVEVSSEEGETRRALFSSPNPMTNAEVRRFRQDHPDQYEQIHGPGTVAEHADYDETPSVATPPGTTAYL